jgi:hypothetical protein
MTVDLGSVTREFGLSKAGATLVDNIFTSEAYNLRRVGSELLSVAPFIDRTTIFFDLIHIKGYSKATNRLYSTARFMAAKTREPEPTRPSANAGTIPLEEFEQFLGVFQDLLVKFENQYEFTVAERAALLNVLQCTSLHNYLAELAIKALKIGFAPEKAKYLAMNFIDPEAYKDFVDLPLQYIIEAVKWGGH